ncbi:MAG: preprotein translocase subunit SecG, partial [Betaproteobacteria bacterium]|nr:preprotein translocase subunit SecG [Betaproteobacteria bacterium]NBY04191.1 preprotein translocase subunit SecG [Betaproteobacteria bacterium]
MNLLLNVLLVVQILTALAMIGLILIQHGKGADMGAAFGSGSSGSLFGASGSANFLSRSTSVLAAIFFACTLALAYFGNLRTSEEGISVLEKAPVSAPVGAGSQIPGQSDSSANPPTAPSQPTAPVAPNGAGQIPK